MILRVEQNSQARQTDYLIPIQICHRKAMKTISAILSIDQDHTTDLDLWSRSFYKWSCPSLATTQVKIRVLSLIFRSFNSLHEIYSPP